jgi:dTDP-4-dehydrorhamnose reductase
MFAQSWGTLVLKVLLLGGTGQLGTALQSLLRGECLAPSHADCPLAEPDALRRLCDQFGPEVIVNAAAYNRVDLAESEPDAAWRVNALGPRLLATEADRLGATLVHISTDHVFASPPGPPALGPTALGPTALGSSLAHPGWRESDPPSPASVYAVTKLAGEHFVRAASPRHLVVRTCGLYGPARSPGKGNFVTTMLRLGRERGEVRVVDDQVCTPTSAADLAASLLALIHHSQGGLFHMTNSGQTSWCEFAREIFRQSGDAVRVVPISTAQFAAPARRPAHSVLACDRLTAVLGQPPRDWRVALGDYLSTLRTGGS